MKDYIKATMPYNTDDEKIDTARSYLHEDGKVWMQSQMKVAEKEETVVTYEQFMSTLRTFFGKGNGSAEAEKEIEDTRPAPHKSFQDFAFCLDVPLTQCNYDNRNKKAKVWAKVPAETKTLMLIGGDQ